MDVQTWRSKLAVRPQTDVNRHSGGGELLQGPPFRSCRLAGWHSPATLGVALSLTVCSDIWKTLEPPIAEGTVPVTTCEA